MRILRDFWNDESGIGTVEIILILVEICTLILDIFCVFIVV